MCISGAIHPIRQTLITYVFSCSDPVVPLRHITNLSTNLCIAIDAKAKTLVVIRREVSELYVH